MPGVTDNGRPEFLLRRAWRFCAGQRQVCRGRQANGTRQKLTAGHCVKGWHRRFGHELAGPVAWPKGGSRLGRRLSYRPDGRRAGAA